MRGRVLVVEAIVQDGRAYIDALPRQRCETYSTMLDSVTTDGSENVRRHKG